MDPLTVVLPPELHDQVIDHLFDDKRALASCSLVCRNWRTSSQYHLFHTIRIRHPVTLESFLELLDGSPHLAPFVRSLSLCSSQCKQDVHLSVTTTGLATCISKLTNLQSLRLDGVFWSNTNRVAPYRASHLRELTMRRLFTTPSVLCDTICAFRSIGTLHIESVFWTFPAETHVSVVEAETDTDADHDERLPSLENLVVGPGSTYNMLQCFLPMLQERMDISALTTLSIEFDHFDAWQQLRAFLHGVSTQLKQLSLKFGKYVVMNEGRCLCPG